MSASQTTALVVLLGVVTACERNEFQPPPPPTVTVATPLQEDVTNYVEFTGTTEPFETVEVRARVEGVLLKIAYREGEEIEIGAPMFENDPAPFAAIRDAADAEVKSAEAQARLAETTANRLEKAYEDRAVSELQLLEAQAQHEVAVAQVDVAEKNLAIRELDLSYTKIAAPIHGKPRKSDFFVGALVGNLGSDALTTIADESKIRVWFTVPDRALLEVKESRTKAGKTDTFPEVELAREIDEDFPFRGRVDYADPTVNPETGTLRVRAVFDNEDGRLLGGLFARVRLAIGTQQGALLVPESALAADQAGRHLLVVGDDDVVERRDITLGANSEHGRIVTKGLEPGDRVVVAGLLRARPGAKVTPRTAGEAQPKPAQPEQAQNK